MRHPGEGRAFVEPVSLQAGRNLPDEAICKKSEIASASKKRWLRNDIPAGVQLGNQFDENSEGECGADLRKEKPSIRVEQTVQGVQAEQVRAPAKARYASGAYRRQQRAVAKVFAGEDV